MSNGDNRIYGGNPAYVHISDGKRKEVGIAIAAQLDREMRKRCTSEHGCFDANGHGKPLCPGCYMIALFNAAVALADANGQSRKELALSMRDAFARLAKRPDDGLTEDIIVKLDPDDAQEALDKHKAAFAESIVQTMGWPIW